MNCVTITHILLQTFSVLLQ